MTIHSLPFFGFALVVLVLYYLLPHRRQNLLLLIASYVFYITVSPYFALVLAVMTLVNYFLGHNVAAGAPGRKWITMAVGFNLLVLVLFKSAGFFVADVLDFLTRLGLPVQTLGLKILLPLGFSFYVLQAISYQVDVYRGHMPVCSVPVDFALFLAYFPKLTAGPIERARTFLPQLARRREVDNGLLAESFTLIVIGLFRKWVVADTLLGAVPSGFWKAPGDFSPVELVAWAVAFGFGVYNDFCGYTHIVRGVSGGFGIRLTRNFITPLFSRNFKEFWNRWHISLSHWLRDYIYYPLSRALVRRVPGIGNPLPIVLPPLLTMTASGLWHGLEWGYLSWGFLMGSCLAVENAVTVRGPVVPPDRLPGWKQVVFGIRTALLGLLATLVFFGNFSYLWDFLRGLSAIGGDVSLSVSLPDSRVFLVIIPALWIDIVQQRSKQELVFLSWSMVARAFLLALALLAIFLFTRAKIPAPFVYQAF